MFFLHAGVVVQLKCALFGTNVCQCDVCQCDVCACVIRHAHYLVGKCAHYVGLMLLTMVYACINIMYICYTYFIYIIACLLVHICLNVKVIIIITVIVGFILSFSIIFLNITIDVVRFISLSILVLFCNKNES